LRRTYSRYQKASRSEKEGILDDFCVNWPARLILLVTITFSFGNESATLVGYPSGHRDHREGITIHGWKALGRRPRALLGRVVCGIDSELAIRRSLSGWLRTKAECLLERKFPGLSHLVKILLPERTEAVAACAGHLDREGFVIFTFTQGKPVTGRLRLSSPGAGD
jgi:hypothetical protein